MIQVFSNSELPHIWATQSQSFGRTSNYNFYFQDEIIYSYGSHFPAAKLFDNNLVLVNSNNYSNTTAKHLSKIRYAVNHKEIIYLPEPDVNRFNKLTSFNKLISGHKTNINYFLDLISDYSSKHIRARKYSYLGQIEQAKSDVVKYCELFNIKLLRPQKDIINSEIQEIGNLVIKQAKKENDIHKRKELKRLRTWTGDNKLKQNKTGVYIRINEDREEIQTNRGANVPLREAKILFNRIQTNKSVKGFQIGHYTVISINGTLKIGCHEITRQEIKRFANYYNW